VAQAGGHHEPKQDTAPASVGGVMTAQERAERRILGILLVEPERWQNVQVSLSVEDFATAELKSLAEALWEHQRSEGQTVFNEFVATLPDAALKSLAIELAAEIEDLADREQASDLDAMLVEGMEYLKGLHRKREEQRLLMSAPSADEAQQLEMLKKLQELARKPDIRRLGP
jgi:hypothetical protein